MAEESKAYELGGDELTFLRTVVLEFMLIQTMREVMRMNPNKDEQNKLFDRLKAGSELFNRELNNDGTEQSKAWKAEIEKMINRIYFGVGSDDPAWEKLK